MPRPKKVAPVKRKRKQSPKLKAQRAKTLKANALKGRKIKVVLRRQYNIGGKSYGPGIMELPIPIASTLQGLEHNWDKHEAMLHGTKSCVVGPRGLTGHRVTQMPDNVFKDPGWPHKIPEESFVPKGG